MRPSPRELAIDEQLKSAFPEIGKSPSGRRVSEMPPRRHTDAILADMVDRQREVEKRIPIGRKRKRSRRRRPRISVTWFCTGGGAS